MASKQLKWLVYLIYTLLRFSFCSQKPMYATGTCEPKNYRQVCVMPGVCVCVLFCFLVLVITKGGAVFLLSCLNRS